MEPSNSSSAGNPKALAVEDSLDIDKCIHLDLCCNCGAFTPTTPKLFGNYEKVYSELKPYVADGYEHPYKLYFMVAQPFNKKYHVNYDWYNSTKAIDYLRKLWKGDMYVITRETEATQTHFNLLIWSKDDLKKYHQKARGKFGYYVEEVTNMYCPDVRDRILKYMIKESHQRKFRHGIDYLYGYSNLKKSRKSPVLAVPRAPERTSDKNIFIEV